MLFDPNMEQNNESVWEELDDADFEECILKETEYLSQHPAITNKATSSVSKSTLKDTSNQWISGNHNSFNNNSISNTKGISNFQTKNYSNGGIYSKSKKTNGNNHFLFDNSFPHIPKKQSFYKPLDIGASTSIPKPPVKTPEREESSKSSGDLKSLQHQLEMVLREKAALEEENMIKQGEVMNLRCELKRKEASLDSERVDQCIALEAAEKRGKEKVLKSVSEMEVKVKFLEKEVDKHQGNLMFKNKEIEELLAKCKILELRSVNSFKVVDKSPSPKRRKLDAFGSPTKSALNFASRFDFGEGKRPLKDIQTQTESEKKGKKRNVLKITTARGQTLGNRKVFYLLSSQEIESFSNSSTSCNGSSSKDQSSLLAKMIFTEYSRSHAGHSEHELVKYACDHIEKLLREDEALSFKGKEADKPLLSSATLPSITMLSVTQSNNETISQNALQTLASCLLKFLKEKDVNDVAVSSVLVSMSSLAKQCSNIPTHLCNSINESLKKCCDLPIKDDVIGNLFILLNTLVTLDNYTQSICPNNSDTCLLRRILNLFPNTRMRLWSREINDQMMGFIAALLQYPESFVKNKNCKCSAILLTHFINHLFHLTKLVARDVDWFPLLTGMKVLHLWHNKDINWWDKANHLHSYTALLGAIVRKSKYLKENGLIDNTWELLYDLYEIDET